MREDVLARTGAPHRLEVSLAVEREALVHLAVEVDGQLRDAQERARPHEVLGAVLGDEPTGELQLAVEPRVEQRAAVDLDTRLQQPLRTRGGTRLQLERRRVGVGAEDPERGGRGGAIRLHPGDDCAVAHDDAPTGTRRPLVALLEPLEAGRLEAGGDRCGGVVRRGRVADEVGEVGEVGVTIELRHPPIQHRAGLPSKTAQGRGRVGVPDAAPTRSARRPAAASAPP